MQIRKACGAGVTFRTASMQKSIASRNPRSRSETAGPWTSGEKAELKGCQSSDVWGRGMGPKSMRTTRIVPRAYGFSAANCVSLSILLDSVRAG